MRLSVNIAPKFGKSFNFRVGVDTSSRRWLKLLRLRFFTAAVRVVPTTTNASSRLRTPSRALFPPPQHRGFVCSYLQTHTPPDTDRLERTNRTPFVPTRPVDSHLVVSCVVRMRAHAIRVAVPCALPLSPSLLASRRKPSSEHMHPVLRPPVSNDKHRLGRPLL